jgi:M6 family metalloprotease-like protein
MTRNLPRSLAGVGLLLAACVALAQEKAPPKPALPDLSEFKTVQTATTTRIAKAAPPAAAAQPGYLGVSTAPDGKGRLVVAEVEDESPASRAGLQKGDVLVKLAEQAVADNEALRGFLQSKAPGDAVKLSVRRQDKPLELTATLGAPSRPMTTGPTQRAVMGIQVGAPKEGEGVAVEAVTPELPAAAAGLKAGDVLVQVDDTPVRGNRSLTEALADKRPGDTVTVTYLRDKKKAEVKVKLAAGEGDGRRPGNWDDRDRGPWKKDVYRLAVVCIEYPDVKHNAKVTAKDWAESLFTKGTYVNKTNATGQPVHGSLNDYYHELSCGAFRVEGKVFDWVTVKKDRGDYSQGTGTGSANRTALLAEALDVLLERDGKEALKDFDGIYFIYAGDRVQTSRGGLYWPHRATFSHQGKRWPYFICQEGGSRMNNISVICHEFGHMLGLPDLYARPENPGSEGVGVWCAMSNQLGGGRPQHFSAWCKEQLGWLKPAVIDPTVKQKLILGPINGSDKECYKILVRPDGSEYLLLENRRRKGFDQELPAEGLLIWRVVQNKPILEESHGVEGPSGPRSHPNSVPYPSGANNAFTPYTTPSSRSQLGGGLPVHITNIRKLADGRVTFHVGYEYQ